MMKTNMIYNPGTNHETRELLNTAHMAMSMGGNFLSALSVELLDQAAQSAFSFRRMRRDFYGNLGA